MRTDFVVTCPYCGEHVEIYLEPEVEGALVQDCDVCCQPWQMYVSNDEGHRSVDVTRSDE